MNFEFQKAIRQMEELCMSGPQSDGGNSAEVQVLRIEIDRRIAALELGLSEDATWERIDRVVAADNVASPRYRR